MVGHRLGHGITCQTTPMNKSFKQWRNKPGIRIRKPDCNALSKNVIRGPAKTTPSLQVPSPVS